MLDHRVYARPFYANTQQANEVVADNCGSVLFKQRQTVNWTQIKKSCKNDKSVNKRILKMNGQRMPSLMEPMMNLCCVNDFQQSAPRASSSESATVPMASLLNLMISPYLSSDSFLTASHLWWLSSTLREWFEKSADCWSSDGRH